MTTQSFHLGQLLTITDGKMVSPNHVAGIYDLVDFVTGEKHSTHQLPRAADVVKPWLLEQHPWLAEITVPSGLNSMEKVLGWLVGATEKWGANHDVEAMPLGMYVGREPLAEFKEMAPNAITVPVEIPREDG